MQDAEAITCYKKCSHMTKSTFKGKTEQPNKMNLLNIEHVADIEYLLELRIMIKSRVFLSVSKEMADETTFSIDSMASGVYC